MKMNEDFICLSRSNIDAVREKEHRENFLFSTNSWEVVAFEQRRVHSNGKSLSGLELIPFRFFHGHIVIV